MRLVIALPEACVRRDIGPSVLAELEPGLELEIGPLIELPEDVEAWSRGAPHRDHTSEVTTAEVTRSTEDRTSLGWPMAIHESRGLDASGRLRQVRLHAAYALIEHGALVAIRAADPARLDARRDELLALLRTARPDWGTPVGASLADLLEA